MRKLVEEIKISSLIWKEYVKLNYRLKDFYFNYRELRVLYIICLWSKY